MIVELMYGVATIYGICWGCVIYLMNWWEIYVVENMHVICWEFCYNPCDGIRNAYD